MTPNPDPAPSTAPVEGQLFRSGSTFFERFAALSALVLVVVVAVFLHGLLGELGPPLDDSYIHLQFARSLAAGDGMAFRAGQWVSGSTGPLWTALLSLGQLLPLAVLSLDPVLFALFLGCFFYLLAAVELVRLLRAYRLMDGIVVLGMLLFVANDLMLWSAFSGMEIPLFLYLTALGMRLHAQRLGEERSGSQRLGWAVVPLTLGLACLARPEGLLLLALAFGERLWVQLRSRQATEEVSGGSRLLAVSRGLVVPILVAIVVLLPFGLFGWISAGEPLPTTFQVKTDSQPRGYPAMRDLWRCAEVLFRALPIPLFFAGAGIVRLLQGVAEQGGSAQSEPSRQNSWLPALWLLALPLAYSSLTAQGSQMPLGNFGRYAYPLALPLIVVGCLGLDGLLRGLRRLATSGGWRAVVSTVALVLVAAPTVWGAYQGVGRLSRNMYDVRTGDVAMALWLRENVSAQVVLGVQDIGAIGYITDNAIFDLVGIVDPEVIAIVKQRAVEPGDGLRRLRSLLDAARGRGVALFVLFPESYGGLEALRAAVPGNWRVIHGIEIPGNITLAGSRMVAVVPPWAQRSAATANSPANPQLGANP